MSRRSLSLRSVSLSPLLATRELLFFLLLFQSELGLQTQARRIEPHERGPTEQQNEDDHDDHAHLRAAAATAATAATAGAAATDDDEVALRGRGRRRLF